MAISMKMEDPFLIYLFGWEIFGEIWNQICLGCYQPIKILFWEQFLNNEMYTVIFWTWRKLARQAWTTECRLSWLRPLNSQDV